MSRSLFAALATLAIVVTPLAAEAAPTACPHQYVGGEAPDLLNDRLSARTRELCFTEFAVLHSGQTRTPLYAAEHLTRRQVKDARGDERKNAFHEEEALPAKERARLADYKRSGYDRGHLAPSANMPEPASQHESFSMANVVPQAPGNNRGIWANIERSVRNWAMQSGELYVVTGVAFKGTELQSLRGRVLIPTHMWKAVYDPARAIAGAYVTVNASGSDWQEVSIADLRDFVGIDPFPGLRETVKTKSVDLPDPIGYRERSASAHQVSTSPSGKAAVQAVATVLMMLAR